MEEDEPDPRDRSGLQVRIATLARRRAEAEERLQASLDAADEMIAAHEIEIKAVRDSAAAEVASVVRRFEERDQLRAHGHDIDDAGLRAIRTEYESIPESQRPKTVVEWFTSLKDPEKAPRTIRDYLPRQEEVDEKKEQSKKKQDVKPVPKVDENRLKSAPKDPSIMTDEEYEAWLQISAMNRLTSHR